MTCIKCGVPLVKADRGNIQLGNPDGFEHIDCSKTKYLGRDMTIPDDPKEFPILPYEPVIEEKVIEPIPEDTSPEWSNYIDPPDFSVMEQDDETNSEEASEKSEE